VGRAARIVRTPEESKALDASHWPMVVIAGSGMAAGGRVLHHLKRFAPDPRSAIVLAGFQAPGTRGAALAQGAREVKIHGAWVPVRAAVHVLDRLSAHADRDGLVAWLAAFERPPRRVFLTHGEPAAADALRIHIRERLGIEARVPDYRDAFELTPLSGA
jgi:metallo-beta-lactamase family protein